jgi:UDP-N-acetylmuramoyl-tripeptide--D-alanyl-D-alanine ligase
MGSLDNIARNKAELVESLPPDGYALLNGDDARVVAMKQYTQAQVLYFGLKSEYDFWADEVQSFGLDGLAFTAHWQGQSHAFRLPLIGRHLVYNTLAAIAVGLLSGLTWDEIEAGLKSQRPVRFVVLPGVNGSTVIDDAYNASPVSTNAALDVLAETPVTGRKLALLGDMLELGDYSEEGHRLVGRKAARVVDQLFVIGELGRFIGEEAEAHGAKRVTYVSDTSEAAHILRDLLKPGDVLLIKASRFAFGNGLGSVVEEVRAESA